jgi:hypothetical protein
VQKSIDGARTAAKKANNSSVPSKLDTIEAAKKSVFSFLTADYHNDEDSIERPGAVREDVQTLGFLGGGVVTPAIQQYFNRTQNEVRRGTSMYNDFVTNQLPALNAALKAVNEKPITINPVR